MVVDSRGEIDIRGLGKSRLQIYLASGTMVIDNPRSSRSTNLHRLTVVGIVGLRRRHLRLLQQSQRSRQLIGRARLHSSADSEVLSLDINTTLGGCLIEVDHS